MKHLNLKLEHLLLEHEKSWSGLSIGGGSSGN